MSDVPNRRASGSILESSIDGLLGAFRLSAVTLRDVIMSQSNLTASPVPSTDGSSTPSPVIPSVQTRRAACTHLTMERLYGDFDCNVCHRPSRWGWVYSCTQDEEDEITDPARNSVPSKPAWTADLTPWIQEAIAKGHYTADQIEKMVAQRQKVIDTIAASEAHFKKTQSQSSSNRTSVRKSTSTSASVNVNPNRPLSAVNEVLVSDLDTTQQSVGQSTITKTRIFPYCRYRACQICRPTYRDRTWQVLEDAFSTKTLPPDLYDIDADRPVSDLNLLQYIGTRKAKAPRPPLRPLDSMGLYRVNAEGRLALDSGNTSGFLENVDSLAADLAHVAVADRNTEADSKGFRDSVKRAFKGMLMSSRTRESWSSKNSKKSARKMEVPENDEAEFDLGLWRELTEELLREAASIPLPGHDSKDGLETEEDEIEVQDGVAVTEEAVVTGTADIIMSV
ncbi:MAG: hypothetical protein Q9166_006189 [cf. Caloplaca sp. 2 TL-2023]